MLAGTVVCLLAPLPALPSSAPTCAVRSWGSYGSGDGQFSSPFGVNVAPSGNVLVADSGNHRVQVFDRTGTFITKWGSQGTGNGFFKFPQDVAVHPSGTIFVADYDNSLIQTFTSDYLFLSQWSVPWGSDLAFDSAGAVYVVNSALPGAGLVRKYSDSGVLIAESVCPSQCFSVPKGVAIDGSGKIFVADYQNKRVAKLDSLSADPPASIGAGILVWGPEDVAIDARGDLYVLEVHRVHRFRTDGTHLASFTPPAGSGLNLMIATSLAVDPSGAVYVTDWMDSRVKVLETTPSASISASPDRPLTGQAVTLDASSCAPLANITKHEWDLDGDGQFEVDTGATPTVPPKIFSQVGAYDVSVRVTADNDRVGQATLRLIVKLAPPAGPVGVSINEGARFTNDPNVAVSVIWPALADTLLVSNDGGFRAAQTFAVAPTVPWTLDSSGPERLPKTIYVRFDAASQTYQDDIILDQTPPQILGVSVRSSGARTLSISGIDQRGRRYRLRIRARDNVSGLESMQLTANRRQPGRLTPFRASVSVNTRAKRLHVRVRDRAGNFSKWRQVSLVRRGRAGRA